MNNKILLKKLSNEKFKFKKWSEYKSSGFKTMRINQIHKLLEDLSGNDIKSMLRDVLRFTDLQNLNDKYFSAISNIGTMYKNNKIEKNFKPHVKRKIIKQIKLSNIQYLDARSMGFKCSKYLWSKCLVEYEPKKRGRHLINDDLIASIQTHLESCSEIAPNRSIKSPTKSDVPSYNVPVFYRNRTLKEIYSSFPHKEEISFASFCNYINPTIKKPHRFSDLCEICEFGRNLKFKLAEIAIEEGFICNNLNNEFDTNELTCFISNLKNKLVF